MAFDSDALLKVVLGAGTAFGAFWAVVQQIRAGRRSEMLAAIKTMDDHLKMKDETIASMKVEHEEYLAYRKSHHEQMQEINARMLVLTEENATLRARSDLSPILDQLRTQGTVTMQILTTMSDLTKTVEHLADKVAEVCHLRGG